MENNELILSNTLVHSEKITKGYIKMMINTFKTMIIFGSIFEILLVIMALTSKEDAVIAWVAVGIIAVCLILVTIVNVKGISNCKYTFKQYEGAVYNYYFFEKNFKVECTFKEKTEASNVEYKFIRSANRSNGLLAIILNDNTLLFIDEETIEDKNAYLKVLDIIEENAQSNSKKNKKKKNKK